MKNLAASGVVALSGLGATRQAKLRIEQLIQQEISPMVTQVHQLPSEDDLSSLLGCSRATVRSALISLQKEGKVHGSPRRGASPSRRSRKGPPSS